jgi:hypothetical protein
MITSLMTAAQDVNMHIMHDSLLLLLLLLLLAQLLLACGGRIR